MSNFVAGIGLATIVVCLAGCSGGKRDLIHSVRGKVLFNGRPTPGALVIFHPVATGTDQSAISRGRVHDDGSYRLTTHTKDDGAPIGKYTVTVIWRKQTDDDEESGPSLLPRRYANRETSQLHAEVKPGENLLPTLQLTK